MQLNTLNRVIALFLIGGFVVVMIAVAFEKEIRKLLEPYAKMDLGAPAGVFLAVALLSITALAGTLVDALGNVTVRRLIRKWAAKRRSRALIFGCAEEFDEQNRWRENFRAFLEKDERFRHLAQEEMIKAASAGMFFRTAEKEHTEWLVQHHSMYHLSANFVIIILAAGVWALREASYLLALGTVVGAYLLFTFALDNHFYTYQLSFRNAYLAMNDAANAATSVGKASEQTLVRVTPVLDAQPEASANTSA
ncbi:MAG TPA: hypothetical protein VEK57_19930 [Thermoanaerobaculia bacterium]|nr:hypothetical protein [Thermoanaerobaculia bacterium]